MAMRQPRLFFAAASPRRCARGRGRPSPPEAHARREEAPGGGEAQAGDGSHRFASRFGNLTVEITFFHRLLYESEESDRPRQDGRRDNRPRGEEGIKSDGR